MTPEPTPSPTLTALTAPVQAVQPIPRVPLQEMLALVRDTELVAAYGREIIESQLAINRFDQDWRLARVFAESGLFADAQAVNQAMTKVQLGRSWNMEPADAMQHVYFVNGKPAVMNEYLGAKMRDAGLDWDIEWHRDKDGTCIGVTLWPRRLTPAGWAPIMERAAGKEIPASVSFTKTDADRVRVKEEGKWIALSEKSTYKSFPDDMYFWRAIARLRRRYATNILSGVMTRDEADEVVPSQIEAPRVPVAAPASDFTPGRQARKRASAEEIPGTGKTDVDTASAPASVAETKPPVSETKPVIAETIAAVAETVAVAVASPWPDDAAMRAAFRAQRARIGAERFEAILNARAGFMFGQATITDPVTIAVYADLAACAGDEKLKKLF